MKTRKKTETQMIQGYKEMADEDRKTVEFALAAQKEILYRKNRTNPDHLQRTFTKKARQNKSGKDAGGRPGAKIEPESLNIL